MSKVKNYTDKQLLDRVKSLPSFTTIPKGYWILGVQSEEDTYNVPDDKFYLFKGEKFIMVTTGTTNSGAYGMKYFKKWNWQGVFVVKTDEWYHELWGEGLHKGKMKALVQINPIKGYRDGDKDKRIEETGKLIYGIFGINFHTMSYRYKLFIKLLIGKWGVGCQVCNDGSAYYRILNYVRGQHKVTYCLLKEF